MGFYSFARSAFDAAVSSRNRKSAADSGKARATDEDSMLTPIERQRVTLEISDLRRNFGLVYGALDRFADFVVGTGITIQAKTADQAWNAAAEAFFEEWGKVADSRRRQQWWQLQRQTVKDLFTAGEAFFVFKSNGQLIPVEAGRIQTPTDFADDSKVIQGIRIGGDGVAVGAYICNRDSRGYVRLDSYEYVNWDDVCHVVDFDRIDQLRGIPILAAVVNSLRDKMEYNEYTQLRAKLDSMMAWHVNTKRNIGPSNLGSRDANPGDTDTTKVKAEKVGAGQIWYSDGEIKSLASNTPNSVYESFNRLIIEEIATALSVPAEILTLNFKSGQIPKQAVSVALKTFERYQKLLTSQLISRVWQWRVAKAMKEGELTLAPLVNGVSQWYRTSFQFPSTGDWGDGAEDQSNLIAYNMGTKSLTEISKKQGKEFPDTLDEKVAEIELAIIKAKEINKKHGTNLSFRELIVSQNPGQFSAAQTKQQEAETGTKQGEQK